MFLKKIIESPAFVPLVLAGLTLVYFIDAFQLGAPVRNGTMTASFFPIAISIVMFVALAYVLGMYLARGRRSRSEPADEPIPQKQAAATFVALATAGYIAGFAYFGYAIPTLIYAFVMTLLLRAGHQSLLGKAAIAIAITAAGYIFFVYGFHVHLPSIEGV